MKSFFSKVVGIGVIMLISVTSSAHASELCAGCDRATTTRWVTNIYPPDQGIDCFRVEIPDKNDSLSVTVSYGNGDSRVIQFKRGALVLFGGEDKPALCLLPRVTEGASRIVVIPGSKDTCLTLSEYDIARLRREHLIEAKSCLGKTAWCAAQ